MPLIIIILILWTTLSNTGLDRRKRERISIRRTWEKIHENMMNSTENCCAVGEVSDLASNSDSDSLSKSMLPWLVVYMSDYT